MRRNIKNKKLYESLMKDVSKIIKKHLSETYSSNASYYIEDEGDGSTKGLYDDLDDAIADAEELARKSRLNGRFLVINAKTEEIEFDSNPNISYKF